MKITSTNRHLAVKLIDDLVNARSSLQSAAKLARELGVTKTLLTDGADSFESRAFKLDSAANELQDALDESDARVAMMVRRV